ncbi:MAG: ATP-dependent Clp protease proteolytic subunit [Planctomycetota bacterium]|nr:ATP-dependent Clp protease proteolytic subunit [Planctomycetota bacterium]
MKSRHSYLRRGYPPQRASRTPSPIQSGPFNPPPSGPDWELAINGDLTDKQHELISSLIEVPRRSRGVIWFDSGGGSVYVGLALCSIIRLRGLRVTGVVAGECSSAAILPFAACERRFVTPHSTLLFHPMRWQSADEVKLEEATEWARHFKNLEGDLDKLLAKLFEFPADKIAEWTNPGRFLTGRELVDAGLARIVDMFDGDLWSQMSRQ